MKNCFGLLGYNIKNSLSPYIHNYFFDLKKFKATYSIFDIPPNKFTFFFKDIDKLNGFNVTIPYKDNIFEKIERKAQTARYFKTTNTVVKEKQGQFICYNTDYFGFSESLKHFEVKLKKNILLLGFGGAGKIVAKKSIDSGCFLTIAVRKASILKAKKTLNFIIPKKSIKNCEIVDIDNIPHKTYNIIVNATPIGMLNCNKSPIKENFFYGCKTAIDLIYYPTETKFLKTAKKLKIKTINGLFMLVAQAKKANELFLKTNFNKDHILKIYKKLKYSLNNT